MMKLGCKLEDLKSMMKDQLLVSLRVSCPDLLEQLWKKVVIENMKLDLNTLPDDLSDF